jgi:hypothetical protein
METTHQLSEANKNSRQASIKGLQILAKLQRMEKKLDSIEKVEENTKGLLDFFKEQ